MKHGMSHMLLGSEGGWGCKALSASAGANGRNYTPIPPIRIVLTARIPLVV